MSPFLVAATVVVLLALALVGVLLLTRLVRRERDAVRRDTRAAAAADSSPDPEDD